MPAAKTKTRSCSARKSAGLGRTWGCSRPAVELARAVAKEWLLPSNHSERLREAAQSYLASRAPAQEER